MSGLQFYLRGGFYEKARESNSRQRIVLLLMLVLTAGACDVTAGRHTACRHTAGRHPDGDRSLSRKFLILNLAHGIPLPVKSASMPGHQCWMSWKRSNGRITYTPSRCGPGAGAEHYDIILDGLSDMGYFTATWTPERFR